LAQTISLVGPNYVNVQLYIEKLIGPNYATWTLDVRLWLKS